MSPSPSDIIWKQYGKKKPFDNLLNLVMDIVLFIVTVIVSTPSNNELILHRIFEKLNINQFIGSSIGSKDKGNTYYKQLV